MTGEGVGDALLEGAERQAIESGADLIGLAVEPSNSRAIRLYVRRGYLEWVHGTVVDSWNEEDASGNVVATHEDVCQYMTKELIRLAKDDSH